MDDGGHFSYLKNNRALHCVRFSVSLCVSVSVSLCLCLSVCLSLLSYSVPTGHLSYSVPTVHLSSPYSNQPFRFL